MHEVKKIKDRIRQLEYQVENNKIDIRRFLKRKPKKFENKVIKAKNNIERIENKIKLYDEMITRLSEVKND